MLLSSSHSSSPLSLTHSTPGRSSYHSARSHQPMSSSPLASPTNYTSPTREVQERRRAQYKSMSSSSRLSVTPAKLLFRSGGQTSEDPQKAFLRERLQSRCRQHAQKLRQRAVSSHRSIDNDVFMDGSEEESDDVIMQDELFRRIMQSTSHRKTHSYRVSYAIEVGSSFDPDMEDAGAWECELKDQNSNVTEPTPDDLEEQELSEYAEQYRALVDFADLDDDLISLSDTDDALGETLRPQDAEMDVS